MPFDEQDKVIISSSSDIVIIHFWLSRIFHLRNQNHASAFYLLFPPVYLSWHRVVPPHAPSSPHPLPSGLVLVTDAMQAMGLPEGTYALGQQNVVIHNNRAMLRGTDTLAGR